MARTKEIMRRSEARIIVFLLKVDRTKRKGGNISYKLGIDYIYTMKILDQMFQKGWVSVHMFEGTKYFNITLKTPINEAKDKLTK